MCADWCVLTGVSEAARKLCGYLYHSPEQVCKVSLKSENFFLPPDHKKNIKFLHHIHVINSEPLIASILYIFLPNGLKFVVSTNSMLKTSLQSLVWTKGKLLVHAPGGASLRGALVWRKCHFFSETEA